MKMGKNGLIEYENSLEGHRSALRRVEAVGHVWFCGTFSCEHIFVDRFLWNVFFVTLFCGTFFL